MSVNLVDYASVGSFGGPAFTTPYTVNPYPRRALYARWAGSSGAFLGVWDSRLVAVTYAGLPLALIARARYQPGGAGTIDWVAEIWRLLDPPTGSNTFAYTAAGQCEASLTLMTATGINAATPEGAVVTATGGAATSSLLPASSDGEVAIDGICVDTALCASLTPTAPSVLIACQQTIGGLPISGAGSQRPGGASSSMVWTWVGVQEFAHVAFAIKPQIETIRRPVEYTYDIWEANPQVRDAAGRIVPPWQVRSNRWIRVLGVQPPTTERPLSFVDDPELGYIESVSYNGDTDRLSIKTDRAELGEIIIARAAGKSTA